MAEKINMLNYYDYKVIHPKSPLDILQVQKKFRFDIQALGAAARDVFNDHLKYEDAFIVKNNQKLDIKMRTKYLFAKDGIPASEWEQWFFSWQENFQCFEELKEQLKKGYSLVAPRPNREGAFSVCAKPEDADLLQLHSGFSKTWSTLVEAYTMSQIESAALWSAPVTSTDVFYTVVADDWPCSKQEDKDTTPLVFVLLELNRLLSGWSETICSFVGKNPYALLEVNATLEYVEVVVYDDIRAIQSSLAEVCRLALAEEEYSMLS